MATQRAPAWDNPMGTDGFEFIEYAAPDPQAMGTLFERMGFEKGYCPEAESYFKSAVSIPIYPSLTDSQQEFAIERIREAVN